MHRPVNPLHVVGVPVPIDPNEIIKRKNELVAERQDIEAVWADCFNVSFPLRGLGLNTPGMVDTRSQLAYAREKQAQIYDTTACNSARLLASSLLTGLTPSNSQWFTRTVPNATQEEAAWLEQASFITWRNIVNSNYNGVAFEGLLDCIHTGMFAMFIRQGEERPYDFEIWPLSNLYMASSTRSGIIDTIYYCYGLTASQAVSEFGEDAVDPLILEASLNRPNEVFEFINLISPRKVVDEFTLPIASITVCVRTKTIVKDSGYHEMPVVVPRLMTLPNSVYTHGLMYEALPTIRSLNKLTEFVLGSADMAVAGMWGAVDDGVLNPRTVTVGARKIISVADKNSLFPLTPQSNFQIAQWMIETMQADIRKILMSDQLVQANGPAMTATEVVERVNMTRRMLGPNYERLQDEFLRPLVERCFNIAWRAGAFPDPPKSLMGKLASVQYLSPLARAQQAEELQAMERYEQSLGMMMQLGHMEVGDNYDWDGSARRKAGLNNVPVVLTLSPQAVQQVRQAKQQAMQQQQMQAQAQAQAGGM